MSRRRLKEIQSKKNNKILEERMKKIMEFADLEWN